MTISITAEEAIKVITKEAEERHRLLEENDTLTGRLNTLELNNKRYLRAIEDLEAELEKHTQNPLQAQVDALTEQLKKENANTQVAKLKTTVHRLGKQLSNEQSLRAKAENHPEIIKQRDRLLTANKQIRDSNIHLQKKLADLRVEFKTKTTSMQQTLNGFELAGTQLLDENKALKNTICCDYGKYDHDNLNCRTCNESEICRRAGEKEQESEKTK